MNEILTLTDPAKDLVLATLFLQPHPRRLAALQEAVRAVDRWDGVLRALELHGVLALAARNVALAGCGVPREVAEPWRRRVEELRGDAGRSVLTARQLVAAATDAGVPVVLLKGAALAGELYGDPALRAQGDVDVLVRSADVRRAVAAAARAGLLASDRQLPLWWYRMFHFHCKLQPVVSFLREVELHWRLHSPALLRGVEPGTLWSRVRRIRVGDHDAFTLDPADQLVHLASHLLSHWHGIPGPPDRSTLAALLDAVQPPARLKWVLDVAAAAEHLCDRLPASELRARAEEWGASAELDWSLHLVRSALALPERVAEWTRQAERDLPAATRRRDLPGERPLAGVDFRLRTALTQLPRWFWPPASYFQRTHAGAHALLRARLSHCARVVLRSAAGILTLPAALLGRTLLGPGRRRRRAAGPGAEQILELAAAWRSWVRSGDPPGQ